MFEQRTFNDFKGNIFLYKKTSNSDQRPSSFEPKANKRTCQFLARSPWDRDPFSLSGVFFAAFPVPRRRPPGPVAARVLSTRCQCSAVPRLSNIQSDSGIPAALSGPSSSLQGGAPFLLQQFTPFSMWRGVSPLPIIRLSGEIHALPSSALPIPSNHLIDRLYPVCCLSIIVFVVRS